MRIKYISLDDDGLHVEYARSEDVVDHSTLIEAPRVEGIGMGPNMFRRVGLSDGPVAGDDLAVTLREEQLYYDEDTLLKVRNTMEVVLQDAAMRWNNHSTLIDSLISELQNAGIKFREVR